MDCRTFRRLHGLWMDGGLAPRHAERLLSHVGGCEGCAHFDAMVRRALLVARNSDAVSVSSDFGERLRRRLAEERVRCATDADIDVIPGTRAPRLAPTWRIAAAAVLVVGGAAVSLDRGAAPATGDAPRFDSAALGAATPSWTALAAPASLPVVVEPVSPDAPAPEFVVVRRAAAMGLVPAQGPAELRDVEAAAVTPAAPLWPTARMASRAAQRFADSEFGAAFVQVRSAH
jgi:hypothetical protein